MMHWCFLFLFIFVSWKEASTGSTRELFDKAQLPKLLDTDMIELYHLRSFPLLLIDTTAGSFSTQTTGLALRSTTTGETIVLQYKPVNYSSCFLPIIAEGEGNNASLIWDKRAEVVYYNSIDTEFWQQSTFLARINGVVYKNYIRWIETYVETNKQFSPQSICSSVNDLSCFTFAETWETFLADSVRLNAILPPRAVELRFLSFHEPVEFQLSVSATPNPSEQPTSTPTVNPTARPTAAITAGPTGLSNRNASAASDPDSSTEDTVGLPVESPDMGPQPGRHFSDDASGVGEISDGMEDGDTNRNRRRMAGYGKKKSKTVAPVIRTKHLRHLADRNPLESVEDSELDRPPRGGGYFPPSDDPLAPPGGEDGETSLEMVSVAEVAEYYSNILSCMEEYQLGDFTNALKSCMSETVGYVHIDGDRYYRIKHRYPFIYVYDYLEYIPDPMYSAVHGADYADVGIIFFIGITAFIGLVASMAKLQVAEFFCTDGFFWWTINSNSDIEGSASEDCDSPTPHHHSEGYIQHQTRTNKVMTKVYSSLGWKVRSFSSQYSSVPTSDDDLAALGYKDRFKIHSFEKETVLPSQDEEEEGRSRGISNVSSSSSGFIGVPRMGSMSYDASSPRAAQIAAAAAVSQDNALSRGENGTVEMKNFKTS